MRTDEQKLKHAPLTLQFGDKEYAVKILTMGKAAEWREKFTAEMEVINESFTSPVAGATAKAVANGFTAAMLRFPEKITEMVFLYAPYLDSKSILDECTDEQMATAFSNIWEVAYPFLAHLGNVMQMVNASPKRNQ